MHRWPTLRNARIKQETSNEEELKTEEGRDHRLKQCILNVDKIWLKKILRWDTYEQEIWTTFKTRQWNMISL
jgi:hypothetical protein